MRIVVFIVVALVSACSAGSITKGPATWHEERWGGVSEQELDSSCGLASLLTIMRHHFDDSSITEQELLRRYIEASSEEELARALREGLSLLELEALAQSFGYTTRRMMLTPDELRKVVAFTPVIVYLELDGYRHFAVVRGSSEHEVWLSDSSRGNVRYSRAAFLSEWQTPEEFRDTWTHPGGLMLFRTEAEQQIVSRLLQEPQSGVPESFRMLRRAFIIRH